jgi:protein TonB
VDPLKDLEPRAATVAASVADSKSAPAPPPAPPPPPVPSEPRGLEWYLKTRAGATSTPVSAPAPPPVAPGKPELVGFDQPYSPPTAANSSDAAQRTAPEANPHQPDVPNPRREPKQEQKREAELFAYIDGVSAGAEEKSGPRFRHKGAIIGALVLASLAIGIAPQAPWHPKLHTFWIHEQQSLRGWLNPQPVTPPQAPAAHEDFGRAGDEYKLPVAETIPDATTDPSQIQVLPVVDPTIKKPNSLGGNAIQATPDATTATPVDQTLQTAPPAQAPDNQPPQTTPQPTQPSTTPVDPPPQSAPTTVAPVVTAPQHSDPFTAAPLPVASAPVRPAPPKNQEQHTASTPANVPSSLKSHMASMTPDAGGNKSPESAMQSIEPVSIPELTERALLVEQPEIAYPTNPKAQPGTVILQVLIGRDGTVQDAKFMQGSLAFAHAAIDGVKLWKFKPYVMNGRPVSVQTMLTISFQPVSQ